MQWRIASYMGLSASQRPQAVRLVYLDLYLVKTHVFVLWNEFLKHETHLRNILINSRRRLWMPWRRTTLVGNLTHEDSMSLDSSQEDVCMDDTDGKYVICINKRFCAAQLEVEAFALFEGGFVLVVFKNVRGQETCFGQSAVRKTLNQQRPCFFFYDCFLHLTVRNYVWIMRV